MTDLVGSTSLVESMTDQGAAELIQKVDAATRALLRSHGGREIDKTDGYLVLFDRVIDGVRFAMELHAHLAEISASEGHTLQVRVAVHVGEVVLWNNPPEDVASGAKPVEVEGLAKPVTARMMGLAPGGRTLLSRAAYEVGRRAGPELHWQAHGEYTFKGVTEPVEVFEVALDGPLPAPPGSAKVRRVRGTRWPLVAVVVALGFAAVAAAMVWSERTREELGMDVAVIGGGYGVTRVPLPVSPNRVRAVKRKGRVVEVWFETRSGAPRLFHRSDDPVLGWQDEQKRVRPIADPRDTLVGLRQVWSPSGETVERVEWIGVDGEVGVVETWTPTADGTIERAFRTPDGAPTHVVIGAEVADTSMRTSRLDARGREVASWHDGRMDQIVRNVAWTEDNQVESLWYTDREENERLLGGVARREVEFDDRRRSVVKRALGIAGEAVPGQYGCATESFEYASNGHTQRCFGPDGEPMAGLDGCEVRAVSRVDHTVFRRCLDSDGAPAVGSEGAYTTKKAYDLDWRPTSRSLLGEGDAVVAPRGEIPGIRSQYDERGLLVRNTWHDVEGAPWWNRTADGFGRGFTYTAAGQLASVTTLDVAGRPAIGRGGYATMYLKYSAGKLAEVGFRDEMSHPVLANGQRHAEVFAYGEGPRPIGITWLGVSREPVVDAYGVHRRELDWIGDAITGVTAFGADGAPVLHPFQGLRELSPQMRFVWCHKYIGEIEGHLMSGECYGVDGALRMNEHGWAAQDIQAQPNEPTESFSFLDEERRPVVSAYGFARLVRERDDEWRVIKYTAFDAEGELIRDGCAYEERDYDPNGYFAEERCLDPNKRPMIGPNGCATLVHDYSPTGLRLSWRCLGPDGAPAAMTPERDGGTVVPPSTSGVRFQYDDFGRVSRGTRTDLSGEEDTMESVYDKRGNLVGSAAWRGEKRILSARGEIHRQERDYDANDAVTEYRYFDEHNQPNSPFAVLRQDNDERGRPIRRAWFRADGTPFEDHGRPAVVHYRYNLHGQVVNNRYEDSDGGAAPQDGCDELMMSYDLRGNRTLERCLGSEGPVDFVSHGATEVRYTHNPSGRRTSMSCWRGQTPGTCQGGFHVHEVDWDVRGELVAQRWLDGAGVALPVAGSP